MIGVLILVYLLNVQKDSEINGHVGFFRIYKEKVLHSNWKRRVDSVCIMQTKQKQQRTHIKDTGFKNCDGKNRSDKPDIGLKQSVHYLICRTTTVSFLSHLHNHTCWRFLYGFRFEYEVIGMNLAEYAAKKTSSAKNISVWSDAN